MVPFNDTRRRLAPIRPQLRLAWETFLDAGMFIGGKAVETFEGEFARYCGVQWCIAVANGTDALELSLRALDIGSGHEVITMANAGGYSTTACLAVGATPVYVDVSPDNCQLAVGAIEHALSPTTRAVVVTHLYGLMNDVGAIRALLQSSGRSDVHIVEDCAQSHGAERRGFKAGSLGTVGAFSFYPTKNLGALGDAGAVVCQDRDLAARLRQLRQYGWRDKYETVLPGGRNSRMDPIQATVLSLQLARLDDANRGRREICNLYRDNLPAGWKLVGGEDTSFVGHLAVAIADEPDGRNRFLSWLRDRAIGCDIHYPRLDCDQPGWQTKSRKSDSLAISRSLTQRVVSLPCFPEMSADELGQVVDAARTFS